MEKALKNIAVVLFSLAILTAGFLLARSGYLSRSMGRAALPVNRAAGLRSVFRRAETVIEAECIRSYLSDKGFLCSDYRTVSLIAGKGVSEGQIISVAGGDSEGTRRLLYLNSPIDNVHSENTPLYRVLDGGSFVIEDENILLSGERSVKMSDLLSDISTLGNELAIPSKFFYYDELSAAVLKSHSIFIGIVEQTEKIDNAMLFTVDRGEEVLRSGEAYSLRVRVLNGLAWRNESGDRVEIIMLPFDETDMLNARTNEHISFVEAMEIQPPEPGEVCVFMTSEGPDLKSDRLFLINNIQGIIRTDGDEVLVEESNLPFAGITRLDELVQALYKAIGFRLKG